MHIPKTLIAGLGGALCAIAVVFSCGDGATTLDADAAVDASCNCATAEPLERRLRMITFSAPSPAKQVIVTLRVNCSDDAVAISGGCKTGNATDQLSLRWSGRDSGSADYRWLCVWDADTDDGTYEVTAQATCLVPEGTP